MNESKSSKLEERVLRAAEAALKEEGAVGPLELFRYMLLLQPVHFEGWKKGIPDYRTLEEHIQVGPAKYANILQIFKEWIQRRGLIPIEVPYTGRTLKGVQQLQVTADGNPEREKFYRTRFGPRDASERKGRQLKEKLSKAPDLVVFEKVSHEGGCNECGAELSRGSFLFMEQGEPLCLECADLHHLIFLPAGDAALSRRARKHSSLSAVVVKFSRARKRYERQGLLVTDTAIQLAEEECAADAPERASRRAQAAVFREVQDAEFVQVVTKALLEQYPNCPASEAESVAAHTAERGSGRVGRSAAGRAMESQALELAIRAHIRHQHTDYDALLMRGVPRLDARAQVRREIDRVMAMWSSPSAAC
ncbi:MAG: DUF2293 domain-containing protein [Limisphaerales bacterium]